jgi:hypothetical protein
MTRLLLLILLMLSSGPAYAEWVAVSHNKEGMMVYVDPDTIRSKGSDLPGQIWSRVNVRLDRNQGGQGHAQETVYARRDYSTSANG